MMAMMQKMMNITTAITPEERLKKKKKKGKDRKGKIQNIKTQLCQKYITNVYQFREYDRSINLSLYTVTCLYHALLVFVFIWILSP